MKCVICRSLNMKQEAAKHPNAITFRSYVALLKLLKDRDEKAIHSICEEHRNVLKLNVVLNDLFDAVPVLRECAVTGIPLSAMPKGRRV